MQLYLVQHGEAVPESVDPTRPLSERGREDIRKLAHLLAENGIRVGRVLHSGKRRASDTAALLIEAVGAGAVVEVMEKGLSPKDSPEYLVDAAETWQKDTLVVGHEAVHEPVPVAARVGPRNTDDRGFCAQHARLSRPSPGDRRLVYRLDAGPRVAAAVAPLPDGSPHRRRLSSLEVLLAHSAHAVALLTRKREPTRRRTALRLYVARAHSRECSGGP
jgi:phosphohistidine phosphatase SixA